MIRVVFINYERLKMYCRYKVNIVFNCNDEYQVGKTKIFTDEQLAKDYLIETLKYNRSILGNPALTKGIMDNDYFGEHYLLLDDESNSYLGYSDGMNEDIYFIEKQIN